MHMEAAAAPIPPWSELPPELLGQITGHLFPSTADRARFRAVCRSWHSAVRHHGPPAHQLPWILHPDGEFLDPSDGYWHRIPSFPDDTVCVGATNGWLALDCRTGDEIRRHSYSLHNPFSGRTVPLPELDTVIGSVSDLFEVRKVLVRSHPAADDDDLVVVFMTNNWNHPVILIRPGKGLWLPKPRTAPFTRIVDVAFLDDDRLYGITEAEDLVSLHIVFHAGGGNDDKPDYVIGFERVIRHPKAANDDDQDDEVVVAATEDKPRMDTGDGDGMVLYEGMKMVHEDEDGFIAMHWYLVESQGKLVMVRRRVMWPSWEAKFTLSVDVLEANLSSTGATWVPVLGGGLHGQALFISKLSSKSVTACGDVHEDDVFFLDTGEVFNVKSQTISPSVWGNDIYRVTWIFAPVLVV